MFQVLMPTENQQYNYLVRFINPDQKSKYVTKIWHEVHDKFESVSHLKQRACDDFEDKLNEVDDIECGYFEKSSKRWIEHDQDLEAMYQVFKGRNCEITLWFSHESPSKRAKKRKGEEPGDIVASKRVSREEAVDKMAQELREKHGEELFSGAQLRLWARMKLNGQHNSMDHPPQIPLFTGTMLSKPKRDSLSDALTNAATAVVGILKSNSQPTNACEEKSMSPGKRARVSGQYLKQLGEIKKLHEIGVLSKSEFQEQKQLALRNIKEINRRS